MKINFVQVIKLLTLLSVFKFTLANPYCPADDVGYGMTEEQLDAIWAETPVARMIAKAEADTFLELPICNNSINKNAIPSEFDARVKWPYCPSLFQIMDQGECNSCWAVAVTSVLTDRYCIANRGKDYFEFSSEDLLACGAEFAAFDKRSGILGCKGGLTDKALKYMELYGTVSGGAFRGSGCKPYPFPTCIHTPRKPRNPFARQCSTDKNTPQCVRQCQPSYRVDFSYKEEVKKIKTACGVKYNDVQEIQTEIMNHGPVVAVINLYESVYKYNRTEGVYRQCPSRDDRQIPMAHAVKIIGWGIENENGLEVPYWLVSNSWNYDWGHNGLIKVIRGTSRVTSLGIEARVYTGLF